MCTKIEADVRVKNKSGLHVRPASYLSKILQGCLSKVTLIYKKESVNAKSIMGLMILAIPRNAKVRLVVEGVDAKKVMEKLITAFETHFGEEE